MFLKFWASRPSCKLWQAVWEVSISPLPCSRRSRCLATSYPHHLPPAPRSCLAPGPTPRGPPPRSPCSWRHRCRARSSGRCGWKNTFAAFKISCDAKMSARSKNLLVSDAEIKRWKGRRAKSIAKLAKLPSWQCKNIFTLYRQSFQKAVKLVEHPVKLQIFQILHENQLQRKFWSRCIRWRDDWLICRGCKSLNSTWRENFVLMSEIISTHVSYIV